MRLAAGLLPDSLGEPESSPIPLAASGGGVSLLRGREGMERERGGRGEGREKMEARGVRGGVSSSLFNFWLWA